jgi:predicted dehydrogenase
MDSRRRFIGTVATGIAGTLAAPPSVLGSNQRIRLGIIGSGDRGMQLAREVITCANTDLAAFADVYTKRLDQAQALVPAAKQMVDYRQLLDEKDIDAVLIATPQHLHAEQFVAAIDAGKHVYLEKTMAFTLDEARRMREVYEKVKGKLVVQIGHQACSSGMMVDAANFLASGRMGKITAIHGYHYRNTPHGKPQWARPIYPDMNPENIAWENFLGDAPDREFDANRYINWRLYSDYSGGNVHENLSQQLAFWYRALGLTIPTAVTMTGGVLLWKDGREVPDTMNVAMEHSEGILFSWHSAFGNNQLGSGEDVLGTDGTISRTGRIRYTAQKVNFPSGKDLLGQSHTPPNAHVANWLDGIRNGVEVNGPFELGYRVSIACRMAVDSYVLGRTVRWDDASEQIV